jgi:glutaredoxin 3
MLNLYYKPSCPYCQRVLQANDGIQAPLVLHDVLADPAHLAALIEKGGKRQVPYLEDTDRGISMYESLDIIEYLRSHYGQGKDVKWDEVGNVCPIE